MKRKILFLIPGLLVISTHLFSQIVDCDKFKEGKFRIEDDLGTLIIERTANSQRETHAKLGVDILFDLKWIDECTFQATLKEVLIDKDGFNYPEDEIVISRIIETYENEYVAEVESVIAQYKNTYRAILIE